MCIYADVSTIYYVHNVHSTGKIKVVKNSCTNIDE